MDFSSLNSSQLFESSNFSELPLSLKLLFAYIGGVVTSFTPCVYPLIPITLATFGAHPEERRSRSFLLAFSYVLGIVLTFSTLGLIAARSGAFFGALLGRPIFAWTFGLFLILLAAWTLEIFGLGFIHRVQSFAARFGGQGFGGAFIMGTLSGFVAAPCAGPALIAILGLAAISGQGLLGAVLLALYALGFGTLFILIGTFSQLLSKLPKSGTWLHGIKFAIAVLLLMVALFVLRPVLHDHLLALAPWSPALITLGVAALVAIALAYFREKRFERFLGAALFSLFLFQAFVPAPGSTTDFKWHRSLAEGKSSAAIRGVTLMVDFFADWCPGCVEYDTKTFPASEVKPLLSQFELAREDFTSQNERTEKLSSELGIEGLPTLLFFRADGSEIVEARISGYLDPQSFAAKLNAVQKLVAK